MNDTDDNDNDKYEKRKNYLKKVIKHLLILNFIFFIGFKISNKELNFSPFSPETKRIIVGDGKIAKIGIISDFQLDRNHTYKNNKFYADNLYNALNYFKKHNIDIIIIAGDITNNGKIINYLYFKKIFYSVYHTNEKPILISLMGNHDFKDINLSKLENQKKFFKYMKSYPYSHYLINNYNFIFWSNNKITNKYSKMEEYTWIKSELQKSKNNLYKKGDPIFVISHMPPLKTVYGSENRWGFFKVYEILKNYPEAISISGHSHYSLRNIKSIWQGEFTALNTQSLSYVDLDKIYQNYRYVRNDSTKSDSMGLIAYLNENNVIFERVQFSTEEVMEERWKINFPIKTCDFIYRFDKMNKKIKPIFEDNNEIKIEKTNEKNFIKNYIVFNAAKHVDYVYAYKINLKSKDKKDNDKNNYYYYSDYYKNKKLRKNVLKFELPKNINKGKYDVEIFAIDSFDNISKPIKGVIYI